MKKRVVFWRVLLFKKASYTEENPLEIANMFNAVHEALSHKGRFALEYVQISTPDCPVASHTVVVGVAAIENGCVVHKMVPSKDMEFWMERGHSSPITMTFPSTLPQDQLNTWQNQCEENQVRFCVVAREFSDSEQRCQQAIVERSQVVVPRKRFAA